MAPNSERVISTIGDSTDGEDYELEEEKNNFVENKLNEECNRKKYSGFTGDTGDTKWASDNGPKTLNFSTSCKLKVMAKYLLEYPKVRMKYKKIKSEFLPPEMKQACLKMDKILGRGWSVIAKHFDVTGGNNELCLRRFYEVNKKMIDKFLIEKEISNFKGKLMADSKKAEYYLKRKAPTADKWLIEIDTSEANWMCKFFELIHDLQWYHIGCGPQNRQFTKYLIFNDDEELSDASEFLARVKADLKLDRNTVTSHLYRGKIDNSIFRRKQMAVNVQDGEMLNIFSNGKFKHWKIHLEKYSVLEEKLIDLLTRNAIDETKMKQFIKSAMRGKLDESIVIDKNLKQEAMKILITAVELIFCVGVKRNHAALLTAAMFFDLLDAGKYSIKDKDMTRKLPMAMKRAVKAGAIIDEIMGRPSRYDYCGAYKTLPNQDVMKLSKIEYEVVQDWIRFKLGKDESDGNVNEVEAALFNELFRDWYGLDMTQLRTGNIILESWTDDTNQQSTGN